MIFDYHQFARRIFHTILYNQDISNIEILLLKSFHRLNLNYFEYNGQSLLHLCCLYNRLDLLKFLVESGHCDISIMNRDGWLPVHIASYLGYMDIVLYLLECH
ncbi:unnamed protein product [Rotaria socialis]|uniref:Ankyrin repeat protein n=1 Tax=Rotaria socialis TaxID=392032 RepID=A0A817U4G5_9BILA|nr:unnamed protein product [Rotaria socialis]